MRGLRGDYKISDYKVSLKRIDFLLDEGGTHSGGEIELSEESLKVKKSEKFFGNKVGVEKVVYEVILEEGYL